ncbi:MAG TPA: S4 domain-containing protein [Pyrinomonadaceae bacterium]|nr:S4 domain-containing protein [Pyrinomonadaceae bacterium]
MRLDLFLRLSRLCSRRSIAQKLCDAGFVLINGRPSKSAHAVKVNDVITMRRRDGAADFRVLVVPDNRNVSKRAAGELLEKIGEQTFEPDDTTGL